MAELYDVMSTLRAVRRLRPDPIPDDVLRRVLENLVHFHQVITVFVVYDFIVDRIHHGFDFESHDVT